MGKACRRFVIFDTCVSYCVVSASVREDNIRALQMRISYNNLLIALACICTLCMVRYLMLNIGISAKGGCLFDLILYVPSIIFQIYRDGSSWVERVLS